MAPRWTATTGDRLFPEFPWNRLAPLWDIAQKHPDGTIDLSVGAPVDSTPPGYPTTDGPSACDRRSSTTSHDVEGFAVLPLSRAPSTRASRCGRGHWPRPR